jgi:hypothetical protein
MYSDFLKRYIHPLCLIKEMWVCALIIAIPCDAQSTLHSYAILIIHDKFHSPKTKTSFMVNFLMYFPSSHVWLKEYWRWIFKIQVCKHVGNIIARIFPLWRTPPQDAKFTIKARWCESGTFFNLQNNHLQIVIRFWKSNCTTIIKTTKSVIAWRFDF